MPNIDQLNVAYKVYEDATKYIGTSTVTMPSLTAITSPLSGAGIAGNVETIVPGYYDAMSVTLNFRTATREAMALAEPRVHHLEFRVIQQIEDSAAGELAQQHVKHVMRVVPKSTGGGTLAPVSPGDISGEYAVRYWAIYIDGKKVQEIDPLNHICIINGKDYLAASNKFLG